MRTAIVGGGAAGFFLAINLKEMVPEMEVTIFEKQQRVLAKVEISGGGRCNCTNTFAGIKDLSAVYPRGHRLMKRLMKSFNQRDSYLWFERHGVRLTIQDDGCVFPASQDSHSIIYCFLMSAQRLGIMINRGCSVTSLDSLNSFDFVVVTTGGSPRPEGLRWLMDKGHDIANPVPSLFSFRIDDTSLQALMGTVVENTIAYIPGANLRADGALLITHWGMSGPAILKLSSYAARLLAEHGYQLPMAVNWTAMHDAEVFAELESFAVRHSQKQLSTINPFGLPARLWSYLVCKCLGERANGRWDSLNKKELNRLANLMSGGDTYQIAGRAPFKDEFVTCGGVTLSSVNPSTLESRSMTGLYFAGEVLDIDGVTGGFNFQAAWTTAYTVALSIARKVEENKVI
ncbi:MAG: aminoacetone oxidase family FAD-binding enzyme [Prevotella sp.]|nr:aminoacetone oxidase family FAD-binding enzyme [Prevotella sp.]